jgi:Bacterial Ig-like domain (group 3)/FG-GAP-like repeat
MSVSKIILALACITLASVQAFSAAAKFAPAVVYGSGASGANSVVAFDVNLDGFPDIVVATNSGVSVLLNNGDGTFGASTTYETGGPMSNAVAVADVNNDGVPDIVVTNMCTETTGCSGVAVLLGRGDGTFQSAVGYASGGLETGEVAVADVNGDGAADLVLTSNCQLFTCAGGTITLLLNNGDGTFKPFTTLSDSKGPVAIADMNGDGHPDLVTGSGVMLGVGDGTFQSANSQVAAGALSITLADLNGDGNQDVVSVLPTGIAVQLGNGDGTLQAQVKYTTGGANPLWIAIADLNGDNIPDLAVVNECSAVTKGVCSNAGTVGVLAGNGDGTFKAAVAFSTGGKLGTSVSVADVNQDGKIDLVVANACANASDCATSNGSTAVLLNNYLAVTTIKVTTSQTPVLPNQSVSFTATITSTASGSGVLNGSPVTFTEGTTTLGTAPTVNGVASLTTSFSKTGYQIVVATYQGDLFHNASHSSVVELVDGYPTSVALNSTLNPANFGQTVTFTAVVTSSGGITPTGTVTFRNGTAFVGTGTLDGTGMATVSTARLLPGTSSITASYNGDSLNAKSTSSAFVETVNQAQLTMTLSSNSASNTSPSGQRVVFTATLSSNGSVPGGTVSFSVNGTTLGSGRLVSGAATLSTTALPVGTDVVTATFTGNADYTDASASVTQTVTP